MKNTHYKRSKTDTCTQKLHFIIN